MKKTKKIILRIIPVLFACLAVITVLGNAGVLAAGDYGISTDLPSGGEELDSVTNLAGSIWTTVTTVAQVAAFIAIIFAGVRYMFASADSKADIKKQTVILVVGAILVFGASIIVQLIMGVVEQVGEV